MELWCQAGGWAAPALALCRHYVNTGTVQSLVWGQCEVGQTHGGLGLSYKPHFSLYPRPHSHDNHNDKNKVISILCDCQHWKSI